jgi:uncharacterized protein YcaQ
MSDRSQLRSQLVSHSLFRQTTLKKAIDKLGFVQADPIRSPARCQDLILRHRVKNYRAGDLERKYASLDLEEDYTFAYGFLPSKNRNALHPRTGYNLSPFEKKVIKAVEKRGPSNSGDLDEHCGNKSVRNAWGGSSKATKQALEKAHHFGYLRVARRDNGIRVYEIAAKVKQKLAPSERFEKLLLLTTNLFGPTSQKFLLSEIRRYNHLVPTPIERKKILYGLVDKGKLGTRRVDETEYVFTKTAKSSPRSKDSVQILAPFDPIVRDRDRFEHLWGWTYRFEAYTPAAKRVRGYYALPILWQHDVIGWATAKVSEMQLAIEFGYERKPQNIRTFKSALEQEVSDLATFLHLEPDAWNLAQHPSSK